MCILNKNVFSKLQQLRLVMRYVQQRCDRSGHTNWESHFGLTEIKDMTFVLVQKRRQAYFLLIFDYSLIKRDSKKPKKEEFYIKFGILTLVFQRQVSFDMPFQKYKLVTAERKILQLFSRSVYIHHHKFLRSTHILNSITLSITNSKCQIV